jgi:hypothetical protein
MALTLFQNITQELTDLEKTTLVPMLIDTLSFTHEKKRVTGKNICDWFKASGYSVTEVRLRKMVNYIRVLNIKQGVDAHIGNSVVIGAGNGYYVTSDPKTVQDQIDSLQGRIDSMAAVVDSLKAQLISIQHKRSA